LPASYNFTIIRSGFCGETRFSDEAGKTFSRTDRPRTRPIATSGVRVAKVSGVLRSSAVVCSCWSQIGVREWRKRGNKQPTAGIRVLPLERETGCRKCQRFLGL